MFQANSDKLREIEKLFKEQALVIEDLTKDIMDKAAPLFDGGWKGRGANTFFDQLASDTIPGLNKVRDYMAQSASTASDSAKVIEDAVKYIHSKCKEFEGIAGL